MKIVFEGTPDHDFYWIAGLMEGEGCFSPPPPSDPKSPRIILRMTDEDVIKRAALIFKVRATKDTYNNRFGYKTVYELRFSGKKAIRWMKKLYPIMGSRKRSQINRAIARG